MSELNVKRVKTPTILQMEAVECGAAALAIMMGYYGKFISLPQVRQDCGVSRDGSKASKMILAARAYGFEANGYKVELEDLNELATPYIVFWNFNHYVVVEGITAQTVYLNDPATGPRTVSLSEFNQSFTGIILTLSPGKDFKPEGRSHSTLSSLKRRLSKEVWPLAFLVMLGILIAIPGLLVPVFTKIFIDSYLVAKMKSWVLPILIGMGITALLKFLLHYLTDHYLMKFETKLSLTDSAKFFWHVLKLPMAFFAQRQTGDIINRVSLNDTVATTISRTVSASFVNIITASLYVLLMLYFSVFLTTIGIIIAVINLLAVKLIAKIRKDKSDLMVAEQGKLIGKALNGLSMIETLKASGRESDFFNQIAGHQAKLVNIHQDLGNKTMLPNKLPTLLNFLNSAIILTIGGLQVMEGMLSIGALVAFQSLMSNFITPLNQLVNAANTIQELSGSIQKIEDVMDYPPQISFEDESISTSSAMSKLSGQVSVENLRFGYSTLDEPLIQDFELHLKPGATVALVGHSGSGKSTLAKLISGLYSPWEGDIKFDGQSMNSISRQVFVSSLAMVDQDIVLFEGSIRDNLTLWDNNIPEQQIIEAAKYAQIHSDITNRENGYHSFIAEDGKNFSGGQRQRLEIARALVNKPRILVMDEATSALDPITEQKIILALRQIGCTLIIVAHRLSTIRGCDEIIVLEKGVVVERGSHQQLIENQSHYAQLVSTTG